MSRSRAGGGPPNRPGCTGAVRLRAVFVALGVFGTGSSSPTCSRTAAVSSRIWSSASRPNGGFRIRTCRVYRAQTKGKVERAIRQSFFYGREFAAHRRTSAQRGTTSAATNAASVIGWPVGIALPGSISLLTNSGISDTATCVEWGVVVLVSGVRTTHRDAEWPPASVTFRGVSARRTVPTAGAVSPTRSETRRGRDP